MASQFQHGDHETMSCCTNSKPMLSAIHDITVSEIGQFGLT